MVVSLAGYRPPRCRGERTRQGELGFPRISVAEFDCRFQVHHGEVVARAVRDAQHVAAISCAGGGAILQTHELHCAVFGLKEFAVGLSFHFVGMRFGFGFARRVPCLGNTKAHDAESRKNYFQLF